MRSPLDHVRSGHRAQPGRLIVRRSAVGGARDDLWRRLEEEQANSI